MVSSRKNIARKLRLNCRTTSILRFPLRLQLHTSRSHRAQKTRPHWAFSPQELKQNEPRTSYNSSNYCCTNFREKQVKKKKKKTKKKTWLSIRGRKEGKTFDFMKLCWQNCNQKTNVIIIMYDFWELWRNISADKRRHNSRKH